MTIKNYIKSNKKRAGIIISIIIIIIGVVPLYFLMYQADPEHPYTVEQITLTTEDNVTLLAVVYTPQAEASQPHPGVVVAHGYCGNKMHMAPTCIELVKRGFTAIALDFRGHGSSGGGLDRDNGLLMDMEAAVAYLETYKNVNKIGLVGHSMGGGAIRQYANAHRSKVTAMVSMGSSTGSGDYPNLLMTEGLLEQTTTPAKVLAEFRSYTGNPNAQADIVYGNFGDGSATKLIFGPTSEHIYEPKEPTILYEMVRWFELAFNGVDPTDITITVSYSHSFHIWTLHGLVALIFVLIVYMSNYIFKGKQIVYPEIEIKEERSMVKLILLYFAIASIFSLVFSQVSGDLFSKVLTISAGDQLFALMFGAAMGNLLILIILSARKRNGGLKDLEAKFKEMCSTNYGRSFIYGIACAILSIVLIAFITQWTSNAAFLTVNEFGTVLAMTILFFPFLFIKEFYFRMLHGYLKIDRSKTKDRLKEYFVMTGVSVFNEAFIFIIILLLTWGGGLALNMTVMLFYTIIQQVLVTWVYMHSGRNILGSTVFLSILVSWMFVAFFPFL